jgi:phosphatidylserine synthase
MVSTIRFRSVKAIEVGWQRSYFALFLIAVALALIASHPRVALVVMAYSYTVAALIVWAYSRIRRRQDSPVVDAPPSTDSPSSL